MAGIKGKLEGYLERVKSHMEEWNLMDDHDSDLLLNYAEVTYILSLIKKDKEGMVCWSCGEDAEHGQRGE